MDPSWHRGKNVQANGAILTLAYQPWYHLRSKIKSAEAAVNFERAFYDESREKL